MKKIALLILFFTISATLWGCSSTCDIIQQKIAQQGHISYVLTAWGKPDHFSTTGIHQHTYVWEIDEDITRDETRYTYKTVNYYDENGYFIGSSEIEEPYTVEVTYHYSFFAAINTDLEGNITWHKVNGNSNGCYTYRSKL